jgi:hypothetical protein
MNGQSLYIIFEYLNHREKRALTSVSKQFNRILRKTQLYQDHKTTNNIENKPHLNQSSIFEHRCEICADHLPYTETKKCSTKDCHTIVHKECIRSLYACSTCEQYTCPLHLTVRDDKRCHHPFACQNQICLNNQLVNWYTDNSYFDHL